MIKSIETDFHGPGGIGSGCNCPWRRCREVLFRAQVSQVRMYRFTKARIPGHVYSRVTRSSVFSCPRWPAVFPSWYLSRILSLISVSSGTYARPPCRNNPSSAVNPSGGDSRYAAAVLANERTQIRSDPVPGLSVDTLGDVSG